MNESKTKRCRDWSVDTENPTTEGCINSFLHTFSENMNTFQNIIKVVCEKSLLYLGISSLAENNIITLGFWNLQPHLTVFIRSCLESVPVLFTLQQYFSICGCIDFEWNPQMSQIGLSQLCRVLALFAVLVHLYWNCFGSRVLPELKQHVTSTAAQRA